MFSETEYGGLNSTQVQKELQYLKIKISENESWKRHRIGEWPDFLCWVSSLLPETESYSECRNLSFIYSIQFLYSPFLRLVDNKKIELSYALNGYTNIWIAFLTLFRTNKFYRLKVSVLWFHLHLLLCFNLNSPGNEFGRSGIKFMYGH